MVRAIYTDAVRAASVKYVPYVRTITRSPSGSHETHAQSDVGVCYFRRLSPATRPEQPLVRRDVSHARVAAVFLRARRGVPGVDVEALRGRGLGRGRGGRSRTSRLGKGDMARLGQVRFRRAQRAVPVQRGDLARRGHQCEGDIGSTGDARANEKGQGVVAPSGSRRKGSSKVCFLKD